VVLEKSGFAAKFMGKWTADYLLTALGASCEFNVKIMDSKHAGRFLYADDKPWASSANECSTRAIRQFSRPGYEGEDGDGAIY
jgi:hypothetical protein